MKQELVWELFAKLSGLTEEEVYRYEFLCQAAMEDVAARCSDEQEGGRQAFAAAALAYYRYVLLTLTDGGSVTVGDVTVSDRGERLSSAQQLCREAFVSLGSPMDDDFVFERMEP